MSYFESLSTSLNRGWAPLRGSLRQGQKLIDLPVPELYDLPHDPREERNRFAEDRRTAHELRAALPRESAWPPPRGAVSADEEARLRSLGYLASSAPARTSYGPNDDPKRLVAAGYDRMASRFADWAAGATDVSRFELVAELEHRLAAGSSVLDLGCGNGLPTARQLARTFRVTGVDLSEAQIEQARQNVPEATFVVGDLTAVEFEPASFDGVVALYSITHVPRAEHPGLFATIARWLRPGGWLLASLGATDDPGWTGDWLGVPMFFSAWDAVTNRRLLRAAGFVLEVDDVRTTREPDGEVAFLWVLARAEGAPTPRP
jgi:SAM-dependent methyltransferase